MAYSKNDFPCMGGTVRLKFHSIKGKYDASMLLISPQSNKPYQYMQLLRALEQRAEQNFDISGLFVKHIEDIRAEAEKSPDKVYCRTCRGKTKDEAKKRAEKELLPHFEELARLLFRPQWESNIQLGNVTLFQYAEYMENNLYLGVDADTANRLKGILHREILPVAGDQRLCDFTKGQQEKAVAAINRNLKRKNYEASMRGYVKRAYKLFFAQIEQTYDFATSPLYLAEQIDVSVRQNRALLNGYRTDHLDAEIRNRLFETARQEESLQDLFLLSLFYSGMSENEIPAHTFREITEFVLDRENVYWLTITKTVPKAKQRHSVISATNPKFSVSAFRVAVLYPWAGKLMNAYVEELRGKGLPTEKIAEMRLSGICEKKEPLWPEEIVCRLEALMKKAGIPDIEVVRTRKTGESYPEKIPADIRLLRKDAEYVALNLCGAGAAMMHAMFGTAWTETDEESYLGLYSPEYTVCRYLHLRRFSPFARESTQSDSSMLGIGGNKKGRYLLGIRNNTDNVQKLCVNADYAINGYWREKKDEK